MSPFAETWVTFTHELRRHLRSPKALVLLILYGLAALLSGLVFVAATRLLQEALAQATGGQAIPDEALSQMKMGGLSLFFGRDEAVLRYLAGIPLIVVFSFKITLLFLPLLIVLNGFDQISGELQSRSLRFSALRARRGALLAGKVLAQAALVLALTAVVDLAVFAYAALSTEGFAVGAGLLAMARFWVLALPHAAAWLGLTALCSSLFRAPVLSLLTAFCANLAFWILALLARFSDALAPLAWVTPSHWESGLLSADPLGVLASTGYYLLFAALAFGLAQLRLRTRDL